MSLFDFLNNSLGAAKWRTDAFGGQVRGAPRVIGENANGAIIQEPDNSPAATNARLAMQRIFGGNFDTTPFATRTKIMIKGDNTLPNGMEVTQNRSQVPQAQARATPFEDPTLQTLFQQVPPVIAPAFEKEIKSSPMLAALIAQLLQGK